MLDKEKIKKKVINQKLATLLDSATTNDLGCIILDNPNQQIMYEGERTTVKRLIYEYYFGTTLEESKLRSSCRCSCVHPLHQARY